jgi:hypothetical protein
VSSPPLGAGFFQLNDKRFARRLTEIRTGRAHELRRFTEFSQISVSHFH